LGYRAENRQTNRGKKPTPQLPLAWVIISIHFLFFFSAGRGPAYFWTSVLRPCNGLVP